MRCAFLGILLLFAAAWPARAAGPTRTTFVRGGDHPGFSRLVLDLPGDAEARISQHGDRVQVEIDGSDIAPTTRMPRNVRDMRAGPGRLDLVLAPGARLRRFREGDQLLLDVYDPQPRTAGFTADNAADPGAAIGAAALSGAPSLPTIVRAGTSRAAPGPLVRSERWSQNRIEPSETPTRPVGPASPPIAPAAETVPGPVAAESPPNAASATAPSPASAAGEVPGSPAEHPPATEPIAVAAMHDPATDHGGPAAEAAGEIVLPFGPSTGAAAFRRGEWAVVVFDERRPLDLAPVAADPVLADASVQLLPAATVLRVHVPGTRSLRLARVSAGWSIAAVAEAEPPGLHAIRPQTVAGELRLASRNPGQVVSIADPQSGGALLVGTQRQAGEAVLAGRRTPDFALLPTWLGVVVDPLSDSLAVRPAAGGFTVAPSAGRALALTPADAGTLGLIDAARMTRTYDFPALPIDALHRRLQSATAVAAAAAEQGRGGARIAVGQAMLALGMGAETEAMLTLATADDGRLADDPAAIGLTAMAALVAGRSDETAGLDDPRLPASDEIALWRALRIAARPGGAAAAAAAPLASGLPLLLSYPIPLRDHLLPLAADALVAGGETQAASRLLDVAPDEPSLDLARAATLRDAGDFAGALSRLDRAAAGPDRQARARGTIMAIELRLLAGGMTTAEAADALERAVYSWRGDDLELSLRLRLAELRRRTGAWRVALALLRETLANALVATPAEAPRVRGALQAAFAEAVTQDREHPLPPLELVALIDENPDLVGDGSAGEALAGRLADRLTALDLPKRAGPVLEKLMNAAPPGAVRAEFGARLAAQRMAQNEPTAALAALGASAAEPIAAPLREQRTLIFARATAARGHVAEAIAALEALDTAGSDALRADLLETARDWQGATLALQAIARRDVPESGPLSEQQGRTVLRLASAAAQAGDEAALDALRGRDTGRLPAGRLTEMFDLLTARPVQSASDLPRAAREAVLARNLPTSLEALGPRAR